MQTNPHHTDDTVPPSTPLRVYNGCSICSADLASNASPELQEFLLVEDAESCGTVCDECVTKALYSLAEQYGGYFHRPDRCMVCGGFIQSQSPGTVLVTSERGTLVAHLACSRLRLPRDLPYELDRLRPSVLPFICWTVLGLAFLVLVAKLVELFLS